MSFHSMKYHGEFLRDVQWLCNHNHSESNNQSLPFQWMYCIQLMQFSIKTEIPFSCQFDSAAKIEHNSTMIFFLVTAE